MKKKVTVLALVIVLAVAFVIWRRTSNDQTTNIRPAAPASQPAATTTELEQSTHGTTTPASGSVTLRPQKKFADMGVLERNKIRREIAKKDLSEIFQAMLDAGRVENDPLKQMGLQTTFAAALKEKTPSPAFLQQMKAFLMTSSNSDFERQLVIGALGSAATSESVDLLIQVAANSSEPKIKEAAGSLAGVGDLGRGGAELSSSLERTWRESNDPNLILSSGASMARIGAPSGVELLLDAALNDSAGSDSTRREAAHRALQGIYLPNAVPLLAARLEGQPSTSASAQLVAPLLVKIGDANASRAVISWLQARDEDATAMANDLIVQRTVNPVMLAAWEAALDPSVPFRNEKNRDAIRTGIAGYRAGRTTQP